MSCSAVSKGSRHHNCNSTLDIAGHYYFSQCYCWICCKLWVAAESKIKAIKNYTHTNTPLDFSPLVVSHHEGCHCCHEGSSKDHEVLHLVCQDVFMGSHLDCQKVCMGHQLCHHYAIRAVTWIRKRSSQELSIKWENEKVVKCCQLLSVVVSSLHQTSTWQTWLSCTRQEELTGYFSLHTRTCLLLPLTWWL